MNSYFMLLIISVNLNVGQHIFNRNATVRGKFEYHIFLKNNALASCSGVVIDEWHILTAAHCVYGNTPSQLFVYAGTVVLRRGFTEIYEVHKIHIHEDYHVSRNSVLEMEIKPWSYYHANDIAILTLETPLLFGTYIEGVQLPTKEVVPFSSSKCLITLWDLVKLEDSSSLFAHLSWTEVIITSPAYCQGFGIPIRQNELCVSAPLGAMTVSNVDSGGALVCDGVLAGILLTGNRSPHLPCVHANLYYFLDFIDRIRREEQELFCSLFYPS